MPTEKTLKDRAEANPTQLGDPVSLKAEASNIEPTDRDRPTKDRGKSLKQIAQDKMKENPTQLGDPISLRAETSKTEPTKHDRGALGTSKSSSGKPKI